VCAGFKSYEARTFAYDSLKRLTSAANPESGTIGYQYDSNGNLLVKTDARSASTHLAYDDLNRLKRRWYNGSSSTSSITHNSPSLPSGVVATDEATYTYGEVTNSKGRLTSVSSSTSATNYTGYDAMGRLTTGNQVTDGQTYGLTYGYDLAGNQISMSYPSSRVIERGYDAAGRIAGVKDQQSGTYFAGAVYTDATNRVQYAAHGAVAIIKLGNGLWEHTTFNSRLQPTQIGLGTSSTDSSIVGLSYTYGSTGNNGNVLTHGYAGGGLSYTQTFAYDELNRLTDSGEGVGSWSQLNKYDRYGNRAIDLGGGNQSLYFNAANNRITNSGYAYDGAGNLTNDNTQSFAFDAENKIKTVNGETDVYRYDGDGNRIRKNSTYGEKVRMVYSGGQLIAEYDLSNGALKKEYVYGAKGLIATIEPSLGTKYITADHLSTPRVVTNSSAGVVSRHDYKPFGEEVGSGIGGRTTGMGYDAADGLRQKFTSKERDTETGLDYFLARFYSSTQGRFTSPDPTLLSVNGFNPQTWNRYSYVMNNPLAFVDPLGLWALQAETVYKTDKDGNQLHDKKGHLIVDHVNVTAVRTSKDDTAASLATQLGLTGKGADSFSQRVGGGDNVRLSQQGGDVGRVFGAVEQGLKEQAKFEIEHPDRANQGPTSADCSETACRIAFPQQMFATLIFSVQQADATLSAAGASSSVQAGALRLGDVVRWADAQNHPMHFASFIFRNDEGVPVVFSKSGARGPYETPTTTEIGTKYPGYGTIRGINSAETGYYHPH